MSRYAKIAVVSLSILVFSYVGLGYLLAKTDDDKTYRSLTVYGEVLQRIQEDYVDEPNLRSSPPDRSTACSNPSTPTPAI